MHHDPIKYLYLDEEAGTCYDNHPLRIRVMPYSLPRIMYNTIHNHFPYSDGDIPRQKKKLHPYQLSTMPYTVARMIHFKRMKKPAKKISFELILVPPL